jgi:uncharacterized membrane protein YebE (DUF533 family)
MFDPSQLLNAMLSGGVRGSPLGDLMTGARGGGGGFGGGSPLGGGGPAGGNPLGSILGELLGGSGPGAGGGFGSGLGGGAGAGYGGGGAGGVGGAGMGGMLGQVLGGLFGGGGAPARAPSGGGGVLGQVLGAALGSGRPGAGSGLGGMAGTALISALAAALLNRGGGAAALTPQRAVEAQMQADPETARHTALLLIRAMIAAAKADGQIDAEEQRRILGKLKEAGADAAACAFVEQEIARPSSIDDLIAGIPDRMTAAQVYMASLFAIDVDTEAEKTYLATLARRLGLPAAAT